MLKVKNWEKFQHFKDRKPPWIKLYRELLDDINWHELDPMCAKLLVNIWLIASEAVDKSGALPDIKTLAFRCRVSESVIKTTVSKLSHWLIQDDINVISHRHQDATPETETEIYKEETDSLSCKQDETQSLEEKPKVKLNGFHADAVTLLEFLNLKTNRQYRPVAANLDMIVA